MFIAAAIACRCGCPAFTISRMFSEMTFLDDPFFNGIFPRFTGSGKVLKEAELNVILNPKATARPQALEYELKFWDLSSSIFESLRTQPGRHQSIPSQ